MKITNPFLRRALHMPLSTKELNTMKGNEDFSSHVAKVSNSPWSLHQLKITAEYTLHGHNTERGTNNSSKKEALKSLLEEIKTYNYGTRDKKNPHTSDELPPNEQKKPPELPAGHPPLLQKGTNPDIKYTEQKWGQLETDLNEDKKSSAYTANYPIGQEESMHRFGNILANKNTIVDPRCQINEMKVGGVSAGYACSYPRNDKIPDFFEYLLDASVQFLHVVSNDADLFKHSKMQAGMTRYFEPSNGTASSVKLPERVQLPEGFSVTSKHLEDKATGSIHHKTYELILMQGSEIKKVTVLHTHDWTDQTAVSPEDLDAMVKLRESYSKLANSLTHCTAGVGRTGCLVAAQHMAENPVAGLKETVLGLRKTRHNLMVQTPSQTKMMVGWAKARALTNTPPAPPARPQPTQAVYQNVNPLMESIYENTK